MTNKGRCGYCGGWHEHVGEDVNVPNLCESCQVCYAFCEHFEQCTWPEVKKADKPARVHSDEPRSDVAKVVKEVASTDLKEAFESWLVSSDLLSPTHANLDEVWQEFALFAKEVLTPVDNSKRYLQIDLETSKIKMLDTAKLHTNQDGEYVVIEGKRRIRVGRDVAVM